MQFRLNFGKYMSKNPDGTRRTYHRGDIIESDTDLQERFGIVDVAHGMPKFSLVEDVMPVKPNLRRNK